MRFVTIKDEIKDMDANQKSIFLVMERAKILDSLWSFLPWKKKRLKQIDHELDETEREWIKRTQSQRDKEQREMDTFIESNRKLIDKYCNCAKHRRKDV